MHIQQKRTPFYKKKGFLWPVGIILFLVIGTLLAFRLSPWPGALIIRAVFDDNGAKTKQALDKHLPNKEITVLANEQYKKGDSNAYLDVYYPKETEADVALPVIIWTHGGAWLSGDKVDGGGYFKLLASAGYTVVAPNYTLAPEASSPAQIHQLNSVFSFLQEDMQRYRADMENVILAGDSAGSQLSAQMAAIVTNPTYANKIGVEPILEPQQLKGLVLNCGIYKMEGLAHPDPTLPRLLGWGDDVAVWAYAGTHDFTSPIVKDMSPYYHVTGEFPPTYISGGNSDPLTDAQSKPFADKLEDLNVDVTRLFYEADHKPGLPHEYQFNLDTEDGKKALLKTIDFVKTHTK